MDMTVRTSCQQRKLCSRFHFRPQNNLYATHRLSNPCLPKYISCLLVWRLHDIPLPAVTCHFFVEAFFIISHVINYCICSMYHVLTCSGTYVAFISTSCHPPAGAAGTNAHTQHLLRLSYFSFTRNSITVHWQNKCHWQPHFYSTLQQHTLRGTCTKLAFIPKSNYLITHITGHVYL